MGEPMNTESSSVASGQRAWTIERAIDADSIAGRVDELARQISDDYAGCEPLVVGILKGAWVFMADLVRRLSIPIRCDFVRLSSYGLSRETSGDPKILLDVTESLAGRHILLVEDLVDTGLSVAWLREHFQRHEPASIGLCVLLDKPGRRRIEVEPDYVGFEIEDRFVVGYGIDYAEQCRELPYIGYVVDEQTDER